MNENVRCDDYIVRAVNTLKISNDIENIDILYVQHDFVWSNTYIVVSICNGYSNGRTQIKLWTS